MEERIIPPDEKECTEIKDKMKEFSQNGVFFSRVRQYRSDNPPVRMSTIEVLDFGVILKCQAVYSTEKNKIEIFFYLILSDGRWVCGLADAIYDVDVVREKREDGHFLKITYALRTPHGICRRILRKKIED